MTRCARCDWQPTDTATLAEHAQDSGHPLCIVCTRSLTEHEPATCERCITAARQNVASIVSLFDELPAHMGHVRSPTYDSERPSAADGRPLPGGDVLALLGPGSQGLAENGETTRDGDPVSVSYELVWWQRTWQEARHEHIDLVPRFTSRAVHDAAGYLEVHARWAANSHPGFDEFAADMRRLHHRLEKGTSRWRRQVKADVNCFTCGADELVRQLTDDGYDDHFTCQRCGRIVTWNQYLLALRQRLEEAS